MKEAALENKSPQLAMIRRDLTGLPSVILPSRYTVRCFKYGDESAWEDIITESFRRKSSSFAKEMLYDSSFSPKRVIFVCYQGVPVATAAAWYRPKWGKKTGYLHMVGVKPSHSGKGLGVQLSVAALNQMVVDGRDRVVLETDDFRIPAIKTYCKLSFEPLLVHENQRSRWRTILDVLDKPGLAERWADILEDPIFLRDL